MVQADRRREENMMQPFCWKNRVGFFWRCKSMTVDAVTLLFLMLLAPSGVSAQSASFKPAVNYPVGFGVWTAAVGDFNGDRVLDMAVTNSGSASVSILLGNGDGTFRLAGSFNVGSPRSSTAFGVSVGDFNGDAVPDLAVANFNGNNISVLLGYGDGTFQAPMSFPTASPDSVAVGDFNGDGRPDLVATNRFTNNIAVLLGNGDGTFQAGRTFAVGDEPTFVAVGDLNRDGVPDLAVANRAGGGSGSVSVLLGNGDGSFQPALNFGAGLGSRSVVIGDFNGDAVPDLAVANEAADSVSVLLGRGDGIFYAAQNFAVGVQPWAVGVADFNGDGLPDLAVANRGNCGFADCGCPNSSVSVLLGNGDGTLQAPVFFGADEDPQSVTTGDFNGDGLPDLAVANWFSGDVSVLINNTLGTTSGNLLVRGDFEDYAPPDLGAPGWISDNPLRQIPAKSETNQPHSGRQNGACWATDAQDCGMFQEVTAPGTGVYMLTYYANADRDGGLVGANVNGTFAASSSVAVRGFGNYGTTYSVSFNAVAGDTIRVWMYSPASPGYVVIDDVSLTLGLAP
jgi:hypothetical protein